MEIKKEHIKPNLLKVLEENNCVEAFLANTNKYHREGQIAISMVISDKDTADGQLVSSFIWKDSPQGSKFWININKQLPSD